MDSLPRRVVLDSSAAIKFLFEETDSATVRALVAQADVLLGPELALAEIANVTVRKVRAGVVDASAARHVLRSSMALYSRLVPVRLLIEPALELSLKAMISVPDAVFAVLAADEQATLVTADRRLASGLHGVSGAPPVWIPAD